MKENNRNGETLDLIRATQGGGLGSGGFRDPYDEGAYSYDEDQDAYDNEFREEVECTCWDSDSHICSECRHQRGCLEISCGYLEHFDDSETPNDGDDDGEDDYRDDNDDGEEDDTSTVADDSESGICRCDTSKKHHCPRCFHIEKCYLRVSCSEYWFHFPGRQAPELDPPSDYEPIETSHAESPARTGIFWTPQEDQELARLFNAGWDFDDIATELQRTQRAITFRLAKLCLQLNGIQVQPSSNLALSLKQPWTAHEDELLTTLFINRSNLAIISQALRRTEASIGDRIVYLRLVPIGDLDKVAYRSGVGSSKPGMFARRRPTY